MYDMNVGTFESAEIGSRIPVSCRLHPPSLTVWRNYWPYNPRMHTHTYNTCSPLEKQYKFVMSKNLQFWNINEHSTQTDVDELAKFWHSSRRASHLLPSSSSPPPSSPLSPPHFRLFPLNPFFFFAALSRRGRGTGNGNGGCVAS